MMFLNLCEDSNLLNVILFIKYLINIISIIAPIILILTVSFDLMMLVIDPSKKENVNKIFMRIVAAIVIFLLPTFIGLLGSLTGNKNYKNNSCFKNANRETIEALKTREEARRLEEKQSIKLKQLEAKTKREEKARILEKKRKEKELEAKERQEKEEAERQNRIPSKEYGPEVKNGLCYYNQRDYKNVSYPGKKGGTLASHGCGPTSCAVVGCTMLNNKKINPVIAMNWLCGQRNCCYPGGVLNACLTGYLTSIGLDARGPINKHSGSEREIKHALRSNKMIIIRVGPGIFTTGGHYFVLVGINNKDMIEIAEVDDRAKNSRLWSYDEINPSLKDYIIVSGGKYYEK